MCTSNLFSPLWFNRWTIPCWWQDWCICLVLLQPVAVRVEDSFSNCLTKQTLMVTSPGLSAPSCSLRSSAVHPAQEDFTSRILKTGILFFWYYGPFKPGSYWSTDVDGSKLDQHFLWKAFSQLSPWVEENCHLAFRKNKVSLQNWASFV